MNPRRLLSLLFRLGVGLAAIGLLIYFGRIDLRALAGTLARPDLLALACIFMLATAPLAALRWQLLLGALGIEVGFSWSLRANLITLFFSVFLPGAYGGDVVRIGMAYRKAGSGLSRVTFCALVDRLIGLVAAAAIGFCTLPALRSGLREVDYFVPLALLVGLIAGACMFGLLFGVKTAALLARLPSFFKAIHHVFSESVDALRMYAARWPLMIGVFFLAVLLLVMVLGSIAALGLAMGFDALPLPGYFAAGIWAMIANSIPLTPGGLGVGEAAFAQLAHILEPAPSHISYATAFLAMRVLNALIGILGLLPYILHRQEISQAVEQAAAESG